LKKIKNQILKEDENEGFSIVDLSTILPTKFNNFLWNNHLASGGTIIPQEGIILGEPLKEPPQQSDPIFHFDVPDEPRDFEVEFELNGTHLRNITYEIKDLNNALTKSWEGDIIVDTIKDNLIEIPHEFYANSELITTWKIKGIIEPIHPPLTDLPDPPRVSLCFIPTATEY